MTVKLLPPRRFNKKVSHLPGVKRAVHDAAQDMAKDARSKLGHHSKTGDAHVFAEKAGSVDYLVTLAASNENVRGSIAALAINFGWNDAGSEHHEGLAILSTNGLI